MKYTMEIQPPKHGAERFFDREKHEMRCMCGRKLFEASRVCGGSIEIKCNKCGRIVKISFGNE